MRWRQFCAELLAACRRARRRAGGDPRRAARRHPAHPADPGHRHRHRARARRPAQARAVDLRGPDRHRRRLPGRLRPGSTSRRCRSGPRSRTTSPQPPCPKATLALLGQLEDLLEVSIPLGDLPEDARAWERGVDELAEEDEDVARLRPRARGDPGHRRPPRGQRRGDRPGVRALPQAPRADEGPPAPADAAGQRDRAPGPARRRPGAAQHRDAPAPGVAWRRRGRRCRASAPAQSVHGAAVGPGVAGRRRSGRVEVVRQRRPDAGAGAPAPSATAPRRQRVERLSTARPRARRRSTPSRSGSGGAAAPAGSPSGRRRCRAARRRRPGCPCDFDIFSPS